MPARTRGRPGHDRPEVFPISITGKIKGTLQVTSSDRPQPDWFAVGDEDFTITWRSTPKLVNTKTVITDVSLARSSGLINVSDSTVDANVCAAPANDP